jgi:hypothetical protein
MASNKDKTNTVNRPYSGTNENSDPTNEPGQYPVTADQHGIFGGPLPSGTGAPGSPGAYPGPADATNEAGQTEDGLTGISEDQITQSGAPGSQGAVNANGGADTVTYTEASDGILPYKEVTVNDSVSGTADWTGANTQGYGSGGPQLPGIRGNEPEAGSSRYQPGAGRVLRGGRAVRP